MSKDSLAFQAEERVTAFEGIKVRPSGNEDYRVAIKRLSGTIEGTLKPLIQPGERCAVLDFPNYANVGDSAIWLGQLRVLRQLNANVRYVSDRQTHFDERMSKSIHGGIIFLTGGGNLGDLWPDHQAFRESIVEQFPNNRIIQLPQSIHFEKLENLHRAKRVFNRHGNLTLLVRDQVSFELAKNEFKCDVRLCPDMALYLDPIMINVQTLRPTLMLIRTDHESALGGGGA